MEFQSILGFHKPKHMNPEDIVMPDYFPDLNLDRVVTDIMEEQKPYNLTRFYYFLADKEDIRYRQEVLMDLEKENVCQGIADFCTGIRKAKEYLAFREASDHEIQKQKWKLDSACLYLSSISELYKILDREDLSSSGLQAFRNWLSSYRDSKEYRDFQSDTDHLTTQFNEMRYILKIKRDRIIIQQGYLKEDYCKQLKDTFREPTKADHLFTDNPFRIPALSALEEVVLETLKKPYEQVFLELTGYDLKYFDFIDSMLQDFETECQFYIAFLLYKKRMQELGFHFCYPGIEKNIEFKVNNGYDLALARKNAMEKKEVVCNDCYFNHGEQFYVITGPNQGGKTTFARALGQIVYFAMIGLMVPCEAASIPMLDGIFTHFAVEENLDTGAGKLKEELVRLKEMMRNVKQNSFVIINEIFTSAASYDAHMMGKKVLYYFLKADCLGAYVTHIHELSTDDDRIVSLVASLLTEDSNIRTFRMERREAEGRSYANSIVSKHHMTYREIKERLIK